ncbi:hypothetical protein EJB05_54154, partial [Eragrostis curvula]
MDRRLFDAAVSGHAAEIEHLVTHDPAILLGTTPQGNTCLHIAAIHGHEGFCNEVLALDQSLPLLIATNADGETPLLTAAARGHQAFASLLLGCYCSRQLSETILEKDKHGCNALHHAIRRGQRKFALELIEAEPALSKAVNQYAESPMFIAAMRNFTDVFIKLLQIPESAHTGAVGFNVLHAAVGNDNSVIAKKVMETRPWLARQENRSKHTPLHMAANENKANVLRVLLEHDPSLGYLISTDGDPLLCIAASQGHANIARELLKHCPDAPYCDAKGSTCLHIAVSSEQAGFVQFVLESQQLQHLINMTDRSGETALHLARPNDDDSDDSDNSDDSDEEMFDALLNHQGIDTTVLNNAGKPVKWVPPEDTEVPVLEMDSRLLKAAITGDVITMQGLVAHDTGVLYGSTPQGNNCLHISATNGHKLFCEGVLALDQSLLTAVNDSGETPLLTAVASGSVSVVSVLLKFCGGRGLSEEISRKDKHGFNALHHAIRGGDKDLALELIDAEPALSRALTEKKESAMFMAVMRNYDDVFHKLLEIPDSAHQGALSWNALHAAVRNVIAKKILETRPWLARDRNKDGNTPMNLCALWDKVEVLTVMLEHDRSLGYLFSAKDFPLLVNAAYRGHVEVAQELLKHCPDAPYMKPDGWTCLHEAVVAPQMEFVKFVRDSPQLRKLINLQGDKGQTPLHLAVERCDPKMVAALLLYKNIDITMFDNTGDPAAWNLPTEQAKTLNWNEVSMLMLKADPEAKGDIYNLHNQAKDEVTELSKKRIRLLTETYTNNTSLVAILIATITFAGAFTLPGGYSADVGSEGLPIMAKKVAFQAFLISDTLAMCSSLAVAFICVIAKWEDFEFLLYYRYFTKKLMWFAYIATTTAFATGLYTVLAPRLLWLAITVCALTSLLPILTKLLGEWPILKLRFRLGRKFRSDLLDMV